MTLLNLLNVMDGNESITIIDYNSRKELYKGLKLHICSVSIDYDSKIVTIYTQCGRIVIEIC